MSRRAPDFALQNVGSGPDPFALSTLPDEVAFAVLYLLRGPDSEACRTQVRAVADRWEAFSERGAQVAAVVPAPARSVRSWAGEGDLPFPLLADPNATVGGAYGQPVRLGLLAPLSDRFGRMPTVVVVDRRGDEPEVAFAHLGSSPGDRPAVAGVLAVLDDLRGGAD